jgi:hypothetical protein
MSQLGTTNLSISRIQALKGLAGQQSLKAAELSFLGDSSNVARPEVSNVCMPNELYDDASATLQSVAGAWTYTGPAGAGGDWGQSKVSEFFSAYNGVPFINVTPVRTGGIPNGPGGAATSQGRFDLSWGGEFSQSQSYSIAKDVGGGWTTYGVGQLTDSVIAFATETHTWYIKDYLNCGSNKGGSTNIFTKTATYP